MTIIGKDIGYELRCQPPISYDREYTRYLGYSAVKFVVNGGSGAMIMLKDGKCIPIKFDDLIDPVTKKTRIRTVQIDSDDYHMARRYMIRLEKEDLQGEMLQKLAAAVKMSPRISRRDSRSRWSKSGRGDAEPQGSETK